MAGIVDAHSDLLLEVVHAARSEQNPFRSRWLSRLRAGGVSLQVCAMYVEPSVPAPPAFRTLGRQARAFRTLIDKNHDVVVPVLTRTDVQRSGDGRIGLLLALEGASALGREPGLIDGLAGAGLRMASLTWNERNAFAAGCDHSEGLTPLGEELVERMVELGILVDLAHASRQTFEDVVARVPEGRLLVSHAACRAVRDHPRNLDDPQLEAIAAKGGVVGLMPDGLVVDPETPTVSRFIDHVDHAVAAIGVEHVGLGGDFVRQILTALGEEVPSDVGLDELQAPDHYPRLVAGLGERGYTDDELVALLGGNLRRLFEGALPGER